MDKKKTMAASLSNINKKGNLDMSEFLRPEGSYTTHNVLIGALNSQGPSTPQTPPTGKGHKSKFGKTPRENESSFYTDSDISCIDIGIDH